MGAGLTVEVVGSRPLASVHGPERPALLSPGSRGLAAAYQPGRGWLTAGHSAVAVLSLV
jgi:hypothetical protein